MPACRLCSPAAAGYVSPVIEVPERLEFGAQPSMSTQQGFGLVMHEIAKSDTKFASRVVTTSPDVTVSTNLGAWVNRRGLFAREEVADLFKRRTHPLDLQLDIFVKGTAFGTWHRPR